jgi:hypothetical protein
MTTNGNTALRGAAKVPNFAAKLVGSHFSTRVPQDRWRPSSGHWEGRRWELWVDCVYMRCRVISQGELGWEAVACSTGLGYFRTGPEAARACERWAGLL